MKSNNIIYFTIILACFLLLVNSCRTNKESVYKENVSEKKDTFFFLQSEVWMERYVYKEHILVLTLDSNISTENQFSAHVKKWFRDSLVVDTFFFFNNIQNQKIKEIEDAFVKRNIPENRFGLAGCGAEYIIYDEGYFWTISSRNLFDFYEELTGINAFSFLREK